MSHRRLRRLLRMRSGSNSSLEPPRTVPFVAENSGELMLCLKLRWFFRYIFPLSVMYVWSVMRTIAILASLNWGFPKIRSKNFRNILTLIGSCKTNCSNLRVSESLFGLVYVDTFSR